MPNSYPGARIFNLHLTTILVLPPCYFKHAVATRTGFHCVLPLANEQHHEKTCLQFLFFTITTQTDLPTYRR